MIVLLRGHVRQAFDDDNLYSLMKQLVDIYKVDIYIHTWNIQQSSSSWRHMPTITTKITEEKIHAYFRDIATNIKNIIIEDDKLIHIHGNIIGTLHAHSQMPAFGYKCSWYGMYKNIEYIKNNIDNQNELVINTRFDIGKHFMSNPGDFTNKKIMEFVERCILNPKDDIHFIYNRPEIAMENIYAGRVDVQYKFIKNTYFNMDELFQKYPEGNHEKVAWHSNNELFH
jgi:hypothetical protein